MFDRCLERNPRLKAALEREALLPSTDEQKAQYGNMASPPQAVKRRVTLVRGGDACFTRSHSRAIFWLCGAHVSTVAEVLKTRRAAAASGKPSDQWQPSKRTATMLARLAGHRAVVRCLSSLENP